MLEIKTLHLVRKSKKCSKQILSSTGSCKTSSGFFIFEFIMTKINASIAYLYQYSIHPQQFLLSCSMWNQLKLHPLTLLFLVVLYHLSQPEMRQKRFRNIDKSFPFPVLRGKGGSGTKFCFLLFLVQNFMFFRVVQFKSLCFGQLFCKRQSNGGG